MADGQSVVEMDVVSQPGKEGNVMLSHNFFEVFNSVLKGAQIVLITACVQMTFTGSTTILWSDEKLPLRSFQKVDRTPFRFQPNFDVRHTGQQPWHKGF